MRPTGKSCDDLFICSSPNLSSPLLDGAPLAFTNLDAAFEAQRAAEAEAEAGTSTSASSSASRIPRILHVSWKSHARLPVDFVKNLRRWRDLHPAWQIVLWTDADNEALVSAHYPWLQGMWDGMRETAKVFRIDAVRYLYLHRYGGVYVDLDIVPLRALDRLLADGRPHVMLSLVLDPMKAAREVSHHEFDLCNAFMAAAPRSAFFARLTHELLARWVAKGGPDVGPVHYYTGGWLLASVYRWWRESVPGKHADANVVRILPGHVAFPLPWYLHDVDCDLGASSLQKTVNSDAPDVDAAARGRATGPAMLAQIVSPRMQQESSTASHEASSWPFVAVTTADVAPPPSTPVDATSWNSSDARRTCRSKFPDSFALHLHAGSWMVKQTFDGSKEVARRSQEHFFDNYILSRGGAAFGSHFTSANLHAYAFTVAPPERRRKVLASLRRVAAQTSKGGARKQQQQLALYARAMQRILKHGWQFKGMVAAELAARASSATKASSPTDTNDSADADVTTCAAVDAADTHACEKKARVRGQLRKRETKVLKRLWKVLRAFNVGAKHAEACGQPTSSWI